MTHDASETADVHHGLSHGTASLLEGIVQQRSVIEAQLRDEAPLSLAQIERCSSPRVAEQLRGAWQFVVLYPVRAGGRLAGSCVLASARRKSLTAAQKAFLSASMEMLGAALSASLLSEQANKLSEDLVALQQVNKIISQSFDLEDIIRKIVIEGKRLVKTSNCHLFLVDDRLHQLVGSASTQTGAGFRQAHLDLSDPSLATAALSEKRVIAVQEISDASGPGAGWMESMGWRSAIFAPLLTKEQALGVLICSDESRERRFTHEEIARAETLAHQAAIALENARLFQIVSRSQKEWETTFDAMQDCVSVHDTSGKVVRANRALARRLNTTPPKVIGKCCSDLYGRSEFAPNGCPHLQSLQSEGLIVEEVELPAMGGVFQVSVGPWYHKDNSLAGSIHVAKDISNEKLLQQQLIQSEKLSAIGELISGIAHELNNPLTGVMGYSQLLQLRQDLDDRAKESLLKINNLALRCQKIVQNLLSFARKQKPERKLSDINEILERTVELRSYEMQVNNVELVRELERDLPKTIADAHQLQQVFLNVLTNAEQAMLEANGRGRLAIRTRSDRIDNRIEIEIQDDGPGIPEAHLTKIFDPFFTTKQVGKGTGLGLSLSYGIIKEHGGNIYARTRPGGGATFTIELPLISRLQEAPALTPDLTPEAFHFENLVRDKRILVVDDEKYILDFFVEVFQMFPIRVDTANNGRAAMEKMRQKEYDLIITDFKMPEMSGKELFEWVRSERPQLERHIIFVTGDTVSAETRSFFESTPNRYLAKPFKIEEVKQVIQETLQQDA
jgi:two-component system NtrC family sensor kinase